MTIIDLLGFTGLIVFFGVFIYKLKQILTLETNMQNTIIGFVVMLLAFYFVYLYNATTLTKQSAAIFMFVSVFLLLQFVLTVAEVFISFKDVLSKRRKVLRF